MLIFEIVDDVRFFMSIFSLKKEEIMEPKNYFKKREELLAKF